MIMKLATPALSILLLGASPAPARAADPPSALRVLPGQLDLGRHPVGTKLDCGVWVLNGGDEPVLLQRVAASCGCTTARLAPTTLVPCAALHVPIHVTVPKSPGVSKAVSVTFFPADGAPVRLPVHIASEAEEAAEDEETVIETAAAPEADTDPAAEAAHRYLDAMMPGLTFGDFQADGTDVTAVAWSADGATPVGLVTCRLAPGGRVESVLLRSIDPISS